MALNRNLKIASVSLDITWADPEESRLSSRKALEALPDDVDVAVLPELFTTGFVTREDEARKLAEKWEDSPTLTFLKKESAQNNLAICTSFLVDDGDDKPKNRCVFVEPSGEVTFYDKHHLFSISPESSLLEAGSSKSPIVRFRGWNFCMAVCYDVRFPVWTRNVNNAYDLLIVPANWPSGRGYQWEHLLIGRAIENQSYTIGANRSGHDDFGKYDDLTFVFDYLGMSIGKPLETKVQFGNATKIILAELSQNDLENFRKHFPVYKDADNFKLI